MKGFDCMYFPSVDERTPTHIRERMLKLRDADTYFDSNDNKFWFELPEIITLLTTACLPSKMRISRSIESFSIFTSTGITLKNKSLHNVNVIY